MDFASNDDEPHPSGASAKDFELEEFAHSYADELEDELGWVEYGIIMLKEFVKEDEFYSEYGVTYESFKALKKSAKIMIESSRHRHDSYILFFNQIVNYCRKNNISAKLIFQEMVDDLEIRIES